MNSVVRLLAIFVTSLSLFIGGAAYTHPRESGDRTLSPYFFVKSDDPQVDPLPLRSTSAVVNIAGVIADVRVTQIYKNEGRKPLEAVYVFPASTKAAVYGVKMTIGERMIEAKIEKKEEARRRYEEARDQGKTASLLEQKRPNVFQMNVANIMPGDEIKVELKYTELLVPADRTYEFVYPTVVGPRYSSPSAEKASPDEAWSRNPTLHQGAPPTYTFDITVNLAAGLPVRDILCPSHRVSTVFEDPTVARVKLDPSERQGGNRDYILRYRLYGDSIQSGLLLYEGEKESFFLLMMQPPARVRRSEIPCREYLFIVDVSGSMYGFPLDVSKKLLKNLIGGLRPVDKFNVLLFSGGSSLMSERSVPATPENAQRAVDLIDRQQGGGGTELLPALRRAVALEKSEGYSRTIVIATDGYVTVEEEVFDLIRRNLGHANIFPFGIGSSVNRHIIEGMARAGMGEPFIITRVEEAQSKAERFRSLIESPVLTQVAVEFAGFKTYDVEPTSVPDVLAERPVILFGKWRGRAGGKITVSGMGGNGFFRETIDVGNAKSSKSNSALRYLWARHRIAMLSDDNMLHPTDARIKEVTDLGLAHNLLTAYTSFVAIDSEVRNQSAERTTVRQPLPLPEGVSDNAVGGFTASLGPGVKMAAKEMTKDYRWGHHGFEADVEKLIEEKLPARRVRIAELTVSKGLPKEVVLKTIQKNIGDIEGCQPSNGIQGKLDLELTVGPSGRIKAVKVLSSPFKSRDLERAMIECVKKWQFPATGGGGDVKATVSFVFGK